MLASFTQYFLYHKVISLLFTIAHLLRLYLECSQLVNAEQFLAFRPVRALLKYSKTVIYAFTSVFLQLLVGN